MKKEALKNGPNEPFKIHKQNENDIIIDIKNYYPHDTEVEEINNKTEIINSNPFSNSFNKESQDIIENSQDLEKNESLVLGQDNQNIQKEESLISNYKDSNYIFENKQDCQKDISMRNYNDSNDKSENIQNIPKDSSMSYYKDPNDEFENQQNLQKDKSMDNNKDSHFNLENLEVNRDLQKDGFEALNPKDHIINKKNNKNLAGSVVILKNKIPQDTLECNLIIKKSQSTVLKNKKFNETLEKNKNTQNQVSVNICSKSSDNNIEYNKQNTENKVIIVHSDSNINIEENIRSKFMLKVYGILLFQYIFTFGIILLCQAPRIKLFLIENDGLGIFLIIISLIIFITSFILFYVSQK